ncbi:MAG: ATP-binding protein [Planctomycetota bacterium]
MSIVSLATRTINTKIVYYGPARGGKTTSLQQVHRFIDPEGRQKLVSFKTEGDTTLFFDFLPIDLIDVAGYQVKIQGYTVPGQVKYNSTRRAVLTSADAVVFVVDSGPDRLEASQKSFENLFENLEKVGLEIESTPIVLQYNKRDLPNALALDELRAVFNPERRYAEFETSALRGDGIWPAFCRVAREMVDEVAKRYRISPSSGHAPFGDVLAERLIELGGDPDQEPLAPASSEEMAERSQEIFVSTEGASDADSDAENLEGDRDFQLQSAVRANIEVARLYGEIHQLKSSLEDKVKERTQELEKANAELRQLDRLKDDFIASVSHEFRTPLTSIQSYLDILLEFGVEEPDKQAEFLGIVRQEAARLSELVAKVLDIAALGAEGENASEESIQVCELITQGVKRKRESADGRQIQFLLGLPPRLPAIVGNRARLQQVFENLIDNAIKFSPVGGKVRLSAREAPGAIEISIADSGDGIPEEDRVSIFDRFRQLGNHYTDKPTGIGLGLPLCRMIIEKHGGTIEVESEEGNGSTFTFTLPTGSEENG